MDDSYVAREGTPHAPYVPVSLGSSGHCLSAVLALKVKKMDYILKKG